MIGAIAGDIIGSTREFHNHKSEEFGLFPAQSRFTDDTVLSVALADALLSKENYDGLMRAYGSKYTGRGFGGMFSKWLRTASMGAYNSYGNGSAMRVSPVGYWCETLQETMDLAKWSADFTHNHFY